MHQHIPLLDRSAFPPLAMNHACRGVWRVIDIHFVVYGMFHAYACVWSALAKGEQASVSTMHIFILLRHHATVVDEMT